MKLIMTFLLLAFSTQITLADEDVLSKQTPKNEVYADINTKIEGVDFKSWESDFNESLENHESQCTGKNCQFKNKQAFDPSWDL